MEQEIGEMVIVGRIDNSQIMVSMENLRRVMKNVGGATESVAGDFSRLALMGASAGIAFGLFTRAVGKLFEASKVSPQVATGMQQIGLSLMDLGMKVGPVVGPILEGIADAITTIGEKAVSPVIDILVNVVGDEFLESHGAGIAAGLITAIYTKNIPAAIATAFTIDILANFKGGEDLTLWDKLLLVLKVATISGVIGGAPAGLAVAGIGITTVLITEAISWLKDNWDNTGVFSSGDGSY